MNIAGSSPLTVISSSATIELTNGHKRETRRVVAGDGAAVSSAARRSIMGPHYAAMAA
jgi:hypothetical protein